MKTPQQEPLKPTVLPGEPWDVLATVLHGPRGPTCEYLLVVQCLYSRYPDRSTSADARIPALDKVLSQFGIPTQCDNRPPMQVTTGHHITVKSLGNTPSTWVLNTKRKYHMPRGQMAPRRTS